MNVCLVIPPPHKANQGSNISACSLLCVKCLDIMVHVEAGWRRNTGATQIMFRYRPLVFVLPSSLCCDVLIPPSILFYSTSVSFSSQRERNNMFVNLFFFCVSSCIYISVLTHTELTNQRYMQVCLQLSNPPQWWFKCIEKLKKENNDVVWLHMVFHITNNEMYISIYFNFCFECWNIWLVLIKRKIYIHLFFKLILGSGLIECAS